MVKDWLPHHRDHEEGKDVHLHYFYLTSYWKGYVAVRQGKGNKAHVGWKWNKTVPIGRGCDCVHRKFQGTYENSPRTNVQVFLFVCFLSSLWEAEWTTCWEQRPWNQTAWLWSLAFQPDCLTSLFLIFSTINWGSW